MKRRNAILAATALTTLPLMGVNGAWAADNVFSLGEINVSAHQESDNPVGGSTVTDEEMWEFHRETLPDALNLMPGVVATPGAGSRNEAVINVRGFDRWQVPLMMDGIRLYLPADNRIDFDRFLTPDLAEIQVSKGYVSVLNGPDGMGGAINLVTRKPTKEFEAMGQSTMSIANNGQFNGYTVYGNVGTKQNLYYLQAGAEEKDRERWRVSDSFDATRAENGGNRDHTDKNDWRVNMKAGYTPNATDEYSLNFTKQSGEKHGLAGITGSSGNSTWDWPAWNTWSLYWLSSTKIANIDTLKTKAYYNTFTNTLTGYTNASLSNKSWSSFYDDHAYGGSVEYDTDRISMNTLKAALHYRRDSHTEWQDTYTGTPTFEPKQKSEEDTYSAALENTFHITPKFDWVGGISYDIRNPQQAQDYASGAFVDYKTDNNYAFNWQSAAIYRYSDTGKVHAAVSDRTRFPTMFERFSSRFGGALSNPTLRPERALNKEVGVADNVTPTTRVEATVFHNHVENAIESVSIPYNGSTYSQSQNVGNANYQGFELAVTQAIGSSLEVGGNYTFTYANIHNPTDASYRLSTLPQHKGMIYGKWTPMEGWSVVPSVDLASDRWSNSTTSGSSPARRIGAYELVNLKIGYQVTEGWEVDLSARNLLDQDYQLSDGYPEEGRNFLISTRVQF